MSKLEDLYKVREMLHANGMEMSDEQNKALAEEEEKFIRTELYSVIKQAAGETLGKLQSPFHIVIDFVPEKGLEFVIGKEARKTTAPMETSVEELGDEKESTSDDATQESGAKVIRKQRRKSVGFSVAFPDGTVFHEPQAVDTFILALKKIGLERIASDVGVPQHVGYSVVSEYERKADKPVQRQVDGYYIYTNLGNDVKIDDLQDLSHHFNLGLTITLDEESEEGTGQSVVDRHLPTIDWESYRYNLPIKEQFYHFLYQNKAESTANSYLSTLDKAVRKWVNQEVDERADSVFGYTTVEDVKLCIEMLEASPAYVQENDQKHHSMSAALNQYLLFIEEWEKRFREEEK